MARYIAADELANKLNDLLKDIDRDIDKARAKSKIYSKKFIEGSALQQMGIACALQEVLDAPTEDVVERRKGMWNIIQGNIVVCSVCGMNAPQSMTGCLTNRHLEPNKSNFCPNCGAEMKVVNDAEIH